MNLKNHQRAIASLPKFPMKTARIEKSLLETSASGDIMR